MPDATIDHALPEGSPTGLGYALIRDIAEKIATETDLRSVSDFSLILSGLGGEIRRVSFDEWRHPDFFSLFVCAPESFVLLLPSVPTPLDKVLQASALGHYILHTQKGEHPSKFARGGASPANTEALWFALALILPDSEFDPSVVNEPSHGDNFLADLYNVPEDLVRLKRRIVTANA